MPYRLMGYLHSSVTAGFNRLRSEVGQGSVEYIGLILLVAALVGGVAFATKGGKDIADAIKDKVTDAITNSGKKS